MAPLLLIAAFVATAQPPEAVEREVSRVERPGAIATVIDYRPTLPQGCRVQRAEIAKRLDASGRVAVKLTGETESQAICQGWAWATIRIEAVIQVASKAIREGEPIAAKLERREIRPGREPLETIPEGARAARSIAAGEILEGHLLSTLSARPGDAVPVLVKSGAIAVALIGRAVPCAKGRACAQLPSGRRIEGTLEDGRLVVEAP